MTIFQLPLDCSDSFGNAGCNGGMIDFVFQYIKVNGGIDTEQSYSYQACNDPCRFNRTNIGVNSTVNNEFINFSKFQLDVLGSHASFQLYRSGVYDEPACSSIQDDHCALVVGFDATDNQLYYIVKSSWKTSWGNDGYIWMSRNKNNQCGIATRASYPLVAHWHLFCDL
ncbi:unnamed protein product [Rotaria sp. Silwood1]|nr:unnamed protein product [Rotaria sp. Silwood1]